MQTRQKQVIEAYRRVQKFLQDHPASPPTSYAEPKELLDAVVAKLTDHSFAQVSGLKMSQAEARRLESLVQRLRDRHLKPIVAIARAQMADRPGIEKALRMPPAGLSVLKLVAEAQHIRDAAAIYGPAFVKNGRPENFLDTLGEAIAETENAFGGRAQRLGGRIGAGAGITKELRRGREAVGMLDTIVQVAFEGNDVVLAAWKSAKRVQASPGGRSAVETPIESAAA